MIFTEIKNVYPKASRRRRLIKILRRVTAILFAVGAAACVTVNLAVGGRAWSAVAVWGIYIAATLVFMPDVEADIVGEGAKLAVNVAILLALIDLLLAPGWAHIAVPATLGAAFLALCILLFAGIRQNRRVTPLFLTLAAAVLLSYLYRRLSHGSHIAADILGYVSLALLAAVAIVLRGRLIDEMKKYFHTR